MSRINVTIGQLVLRGFEADARKPLMESLQTELARILSDPRTAQHWTRSHRTPILRLGRMPLEGGAVGQRKLGAGIASGISRGLKP